MVEWLLIMTLYVAGNTSFRLNNEYMLLYQDGSYAMNLMAHHLRQANFAVSYRVASVKLCLQIRSENAVSPSSQ